MAFTTDTQAIEGLTDTNSFKTGSVVYNVDASTLQLTTLTPYLVIFKGDLIGQSVQLQDATTVGAGYQQCIHNNSTQPILLKNAAGVLLTIMQTNSKVIVYLQVAGDIPGTWSVSLNVTDLETTNQDFAGVKDGFEDFMFDAYAGSGSNDNQYAFTAVANSGSSDIDGAVPVVGNDYEGIHILNSLTSATSRPLVHAFNGINRIKLSAQQESFELRVRIETLSTVAQAFTCRYGLMDIITAGQPTNGVYFQYVPTNAIAQVVTTTPTNLAAGIKQYTQTINGVSYTFTSDATPTAAEVVTGLIALINADTGCAATASGTTTLILTAKVAGTEFTYSVNANLTAVLTTANTPYVGLWALVSVNSSSASPITSVVTVVANQWYRLRAVIKSDGTGVYVYVDNNYVGFLTTTITSAALRYVFKLEKTAGTVSRTTSIDYITWRRTRE